MTSQRGPRDRGRKAVPDTDSLRDLEAELHARQLTDPAAPDDGDAEILLTFIGAHPAVTAKEVVLNGRGTLSYRQADSLLRTLVQEGLLRCDPPDGPYSGRLRLYPVSPERTHP